MAAEPRAELADRPEHAARQFTACAELRLADAGRGRDSDVFYGRCHTLAELGLIDAQRVRDLGSEVAALTTTHRGARHAA